ncbi:MAG: XRE family transcriptional regulator [Acidobacteriota bacterium]
MAKSPPALVKPALLKWARESLGLSVEAAAKKLDVDADVIAAWEAGSDQPTVGMLRKIAHIYKRPLVVFYLPEPPKGFDAMRDFRRLPSEEPRAEPSPALLLEIRRAGERREVAAEILALLDEKPQVRLPRVDVDADPIAVSVQIRALLGVSLEQQTTWPDAWAALREWRDAVEALGVLVFQMQGVPVEEARGFSISDPPVPVVALNPTDWHHPRIFTLMHELAHLALGAGGRCNPTWEDTGADERARIEAFCNRVAANVLVPGPALLAQDIVGNHRAVRWDDADLGSLSRVFRVSEEVVLLRLVELRRATRDDYQDWRRRRPQRAVEPGGGGDFYRNRVARMGRRFIELVFSGFSEGVISAVDASEYLGVKIKRFAKLQDAAFGLAGSSR